jgi:hypothetical protein
MVGLPYPIRLAGGGRRRPKQPTYAAVSRDPVEPVGKNVDWRPKESTFHSGGVDQPKPSVSV